MRSQDIEMTFEDWERMPWRFGWKHEYWDGHAQISPRHKAVIVRLTIRMVAAKLSRRMGWVPSIWRRA